MSLRFFMLTLALFFRLACQFFSNSQFINHLGWNRLNLLRRKMRRAGGKIQVEQQKDQGEGVDGDCSHPCHNILSFGATLQLHRLVLRWNRLPIGRGCGQPNLGCSRISQNGHCLDYVIVLQLSVGPYQHRGLRFPA